MWGRTLVPPRSFLLCWIRSASPTIAILNAIHNWIRCVLCLGKDSIHPDSKHSLRSPQYKLPNPLPWARVPHQSRPPGFCKADPEFAPALYSPNLLCRYGACSTSFCYTDSSSSKWFFPDLFLVCCTSADSF